MSTPADAAAAWLAAQGVAVDASDASKHKVPRKHRGKAGKKAPGSGACGEEGDVREGDDESESATAAVLAPAVASAMRRCFTLARHFRCHHRG